MFRGHQKSSFIDYPKKISTVFFTGGCNFRCPYCHNSSLVNNRGDKLSMEYAIEYLVKRKKMIDAVCISGGEATLHEGIYDFIIETKKLGYLVKIDTNGTNPNFIKKLIDENLLDYIAMDIKAPFKKYNEVTGTTVDIGNINKTINIIIESNIDYEFRTTVCKELLDIHDIIDISKEIKEAKRYIIQNFKDGDTILDGKNKFTSFTKDELEDLKQKISNLFLDFKIRN
ncbi:anaerobic ribonucleoside-triphosphate reductase activating protein [Dethiothermospora halolimnae]|uniref:anaerobic ribonucleoside-triphosphate reductase activating protein n=1 Tax=Dethiothermospora halolimnae TaxID=3114390 RepID=UPI003CCC060A